MINTAWTQLTQCVWTSLKCMAHLKLSHTSQPLVPGSCSAYRAYHFGSRFIVEVGPSILPGCVHWPNAFAKEWQYEFKGVCLQVEVVLPAEMTVR